MSLQLQKFIANPYTGRKQKYIGVQLKMDDRCMVSIWKYKGYSIHQA